MADIGTELLETLVAWSERSELPWRQAWLTMPLTGAVRLRRGDGLDQAAGVRLLGRAGHGGGRVALHPATARASAGG